MVWKLSLPLYERQSPSRTCIHHLQNRICCRLSAYVRKTSPVSSRLSRYWDAHKGAGVQPKILDIDVDIPSSLGFSRQNYS